MSNVPGDVIPPALMTFEKRREVYQLLLSLPIHGQLKVDLYVHWGHSVASATSARERANLLASGIGD